MIRLWAFLFSTGLLFLSLYGWTEGVERYVDQPSGCWAQNKFPCAVRVYGKSFEFERGENAWKVTAGTAFLMTEAEQMKLLLGKVWYRRSHNLKVNTGILQASLNGDCWIEKEKNGYVMIRNLNGTIALVSSGESVQSQIPLGFENWYHGFMGGGVVYQGVLRPIAAQEFLLHWNRLSKLQKDQAAEMMKSYRRNWKAAIEQSARLYQEVVERKIAAEDGEIKRKQALRLREVQEQEELRRKFRNRLYDR